jgi:hypothetical protein
VGRGPPSSHAPVACALIWLTFSASGKLKKSDGGLGHPHPTLLKGSSRSGDSGSKTPPTTCRCSETCRPWEERRRVTPITKLSPSAKVTATTTTIATTSTLSLPSGTTVPTSSSGGGRGVWSRSEYRVGTPVVGTVRLVTVGSHRRPMTVVPIRYSSSDWQMSHRSPHGTMLQHITNESRPHTTPTITTTIVMLQPEKTDKPKTYDRSSHVPEEDDDDDYAVCTVWATNVVDLLQLPERNGGQWHRVKPQPLKLPPDNPEQYFTEASDYFVDSTGIESYTTTQSSWQQHQQQQQQRLCRYGWQQRRQYGTDNHPTTSGRSAIDIYLSCRFVGTVTTHRVIGLLSILLSRPRTSQDIGWIPPSCDTNCSLYSLEYMA